ncbi:hypothetical protein [Sphingopyxis sp. DBS4]|uniref:hypothetical protein n=1 Tax=Sphingopyxis sp. DBS4 TaxID=2968500 RepID=UPI0027D7DF6B|nr:hypothetical protein [Sphingopyxis sp. DBS4]
MRFSSAIRSSGIEDPLGTKASLLESRSIKIETGERPERRNPRRRRKARGDPGSEQRGRSIVTPARRSARDLVEARAVEAIAAQQMVKRRDAEGQRRTARFAHARDRFAQRVKLGGRWPDRRRGRHLHGATSLNVPLMF